MKYHIIMYTPDCTETSETSGDVTSAKIVYHFHGCFRRSQKVVGGAVSADIVYKQWNREPPENKNVSISFCETS